MRERESASSHLISVFSIHRYKSRQQKKNQRIKTIEFMTKTFRMCPSSPWYALFFLFSFFRFRCEFNCERCTMLEQQSEIINFILVVSHRILSPRRMCEWRWFLWNLSDATHRTCEGKAPNFYSTQNTLELIAYPRSTLFCILRLRASTATDNDGDDCMANLLK